MAFGVWLLGGRVLQTVGKRIVQLCPVCAAMIELICASLILIASLSGVPISITETVTCGVIGFAWANEGFHHVRRNGTVRRIFVYWPFSPPAAVAAAFCLAR